MAVRMKDIAEDLGVSLMTVSKALRGHNDISEATRQRVLDRARELDYRPNWVARSLVMRRTHIVGLVIPDLMHSFFAEVARGISRKLEPLSYQMVIANSDESPEAESRQVEALLARNVDGLIIASAQRGGNRDLFRALERRGVPFVLIDRLPRGIRAHFVGVRDELVGEIATTHLIEQGCRRIAHIRGPNIPTANGRFTGYKNALARHKMPVRDHYVIGNQYDNQGGYHCMKRLLDQRWPPDGVFCYNDPLAAGAVKAILEAGLNVPKDIAVVGSGNVSYAGLLRVPLTTVDQSSRQIGETAAELLMQSIDAGGQIKPRQVFLPPKLIVRESSRKK